MQKQTRIVMAMLALAIVMASAGATGQIQTKATVEQIRKELMQLPYYGVFDFLAFGYDRGKVTLMGYAYHPGLKRDAARAVKRVGGVDEVVDKIEELPPSQADDELRWKVYYAIYRDPALARYAPGGGLLWGHRHAYNGGFFPLGSGPFTGFEPAGDYPIHIIVKNLRGMLYGVVDNESDRKLAEFKAREVPGSLGVENNLVVESSRSTRR